MNIKEFLKEKLSNFIYSAVLFLIINIYLFSLNSIKNLSDLIYLDILIITIFIVFTILDYRKMKDRYSSIMELIEDEKDIDSYCIDDNFLEGKIINYIIDYKDKKLEDETKECENQLKDMEEYISRWVHEIKLPLSAMKIILDRDSDDMISSIENELEKMNFLVNSVMYGSRATASAEDIFIKEENLKDIVRTAVKSNSFFLIKNNISPKLGDLDFKVYSDKKWVTYVLGQLINNSIKYSKENGVIEFSAEDKGEFIELKIRDNGIGINEEDLERVFNKGFTGSNGRNSVYKSTGMGLYFSKKIIDKLNHSIEVESVKDKYTLFRIRFYKISDYLSVTKL
ncbi:ATP-binding protein [Clostridium sp.]|uniref:sensor histidine kinase n=1 Tax=Clostridium sp. TaxID=1506 RepID=UPI001B5FF20B|nr:ATP-binding protein [Clostridium sp.]MBP3914548.1 ATP-binding protein [Clostridium sp.]